MARHKVSCCGRFWVALKETCNYNDFIVDYLDIINTIGPVQPEHMINKMLNSNLDYSDYFIERIIIIGISY